MVMRLAGRPQLEELSFKTPSREASGSGRPTSFSLAFAVHDRDGIYDAIRLTIEVTDKEKATLLEGRVQYSFALAADGRDADAKDVLDEFWPAVRRLTLAAFADFEIQPPILPWSVPFRGGGLTSDDGMKEKLD